MTSKRPTVAEILAIVTSTVTRQCDTTPAGKAIAASHEADLRRLATAIARNVAMVVDGMITESKGLEDDGAADESALADLEAGVTG